MGTEKMSESVVNQNIKKVINDLKLLKDHYVIPGSVINILASDISLLANIIGEKDADEKIIKTFIGKTKEGSVKAQIIKDYIGYFFILEDDFSLGGEKWCSPEYDIEFDNETGYWDSEEECLEELKDSVDAFWGIDLKEMESL